MKVKKLENFGNKFGSAGFKWSSMNAKKALTSVHSCRIWCFPFQHRLSRFFHDGIMWTGPPASFRRSPLLLKGGHLSEPPFAPRSAVRKTRLKLSPRISRIFLTGKFDCWLKFIFPKFANWLRNRDGCAIPWLFWVYDGAMCVRRSVHSPSLPHNKRGASMRFPIWVDKFDMLPRFQHKILPYK